MIAQNDRLSNTEAKARQPALRFLMSIIDMVLQKWIPKPQGVDPLNATLPEHSVMPIDLICAEHPWRGLASEDACTSYSEHDLSMAVERGRKAYVAIAKARQQRLLDAMASPGIDFALIGLSCVQRDLYDIIEHSPPDTDAVVEPNLNHRLQARA